MTLDVFEIVKAPNLILNKQSLYIENIDSTIVDIGNKMLRTVKKHGNGIGLAAVQIGLSIQLIILEKSLFFKSKNTELEEIDEKYKEIEDLLISDNAFMLINPKIIQLSEEISKYNEGCLSFPGIFSDVMRPSEVTVEFYDFNNKKRILKFSKDVAAVCVQHEIDHINGITFLERISSIKKQILLKKYYKK